MTITFKQAASLLVLATALGTSTASHAIPVHITATGTITEVSGLHEYANVGETWTLEATYDSDRPNSNSFPNQGTYAGLQDFRITVGATELSQLDSGGVSIGNDLNWFGPGNYNEYFYLAGQFTSSPLGFNFGEQYIFSELADGILDSAALPGDPLIAETFFQQLWTHPRVFSIFDMRDDPEPLWIYGSISSFSASVTSVPEPSVLALFLPAMLGMGLARRRRRGEG